MISFTQQQTLFGDFSQNNSAANLARGASLANIEHRYLLQKYFNNEGTFSIGTVGTSTQTLTGSLSPGAITATLTTAWPNANNITQVTFSDGETKLVSFTNGSTAISWIGGLTGSPTTAISLSGLQFYTLPPNFSKLKTMTITIGNLKWTPVEVLTREEWDRLNVFPYYADIPANFYIYPGGDKGGSIGIWPIPSTTGNTITFNYKFRIPDLSIADYTTPGTVSVTKGATAVTGGSTTFPVTTNVQNESRWIQFAQPTGDNLWYQIANVASTTSLSLYGPYQGSTVTTSSTYTVGQMPLLQEDFHDMLVWKPLMFYYSTIKEDKVKFAQFSSLYKEKLLQLEQYSGSTTINVNLGRRPYSQNPNLFPQNIG